MKHMRLLLFKVERKRLPNDISLVIADWLRSAVGSVCFRWGSTVTDT